MVFEHVSIVLLHFGRDEKLLKGGGNMETCALKDIYIYIGRVEKRYCITYIAFGQTWGWL